MRRLGATLPFPLVFSPEPGFAVAVPWTAVVAGLRGVTFEWPKLSLATLSKKEIYHRLNIRNA